MKLRIKLTLIVLALVAAQSTVFAQCDPFFGDLVINEIMAANDQTASDPAGEFDDWIEIYNNSDEARDLTGYFVSDNHGNRTKFQFPDFVLEPYSHVIIWCDNQPEQEGFHATFNLSADGEEVGLYNTDTTSVDYLRYGPIPDDISIGRYPNGQGPFKVLIPTFNADNINSVQPGLVINEYQASNETTAQDQWGGYEDWVELYNNSNQPIDMSGYFLSDKVGSPTLFEFPDTIIQPDDYMIIWCDQGLMEPGLHTFFKLGADGDDLLLSNADTLTIDYVRFATQIPDDSEGRFGNGTGKIACLIPTFEFSNGQPVSVRNVEQKDPLEVWPNPAKNAFWIKPDIHERSVLRLYDLSGRLVKEAAISPGEQQIQVANLPTGLYLVKLGERHLKLTLQ
jgi:hypothetical protein